MNRTSNSTALQVELFAEVLDAWAEDGRQNTQPRGVLAQVLDSMPVLYSMASKFRNKSELNMLTEDFWVIARPVETNSGKLFPVVSAAFRVEPQTIKCSLRLGLFREDQGRRIDAYGLRFESAESAEAGDDGSAPHTYPHCQPIRAWSTDGVCLIHRDGVRDSASGKVCTECEQTSETGTTTSTLALDVLRPAIPLRCRSLPGLAVAAMASTHGAGITRTILETRAKLSGASCPAALSNDFAHILGEDGQAHFPI